MRERVIVGPRWLRRSSVVGHRQYSVEVKKKLFICPRCGKEFSSEQVEFIRCPYCGMKVLFKKTPPVAAKVKAD